MKRMAFVSACVVVFVAARSAGAEGLVDPATVNGDGTARRESLAQLKEAYVFTAEPAKDAPAGPQSPILSRRLATVDEPVEMEAVKITESIARRDLAKAIKDRQEAEAADEFRWNKGGLLKKYQWGGREVDLGLWPKLVAETPGKLMPESIGIRVDIVRIKW